MEKDAVYDKKIDKRFSEMGFAAPAVKEGCIIDYEYEIISPLQAHLPTWEFQGELPKLVIYAVPLFDIFSVVSGKPAMAKMLSQSMLIRL